MATRTAHLREVWITDSGVATGAGLSLEETWQMLLTGKTAIRDITRFPVSSYRSSLGSCIPQLQPSGSASLIHILLHLLVDQMGPVPKNSLLVTATTKAGIDNLEKLKRGVAAQSQDILTSSLSNIIADKLGLANNRPLNVSAACASSTVAVAQGAALISSGAIESAVISSADVITEFVFSGFSALQVLSPFPCKPFDKYRAGLSLGEGASFLTLMSAGRAKRLGLHEKGTIAGFGIANDAVHITTPDRNGSGLIKAVTRAMDVAKIKKNNIAGISAHGTGTIHNDLMELAAFHSVFDEDCPPIYSVKGCIGHTFGAAGGIEIVLGNKALSEQTIPPTVGFSEPETGAEGLVSSQPLSIKGDYLLVTNSGFGGINAAIVLKRGAQL